jgi:hypothetical protein
MLIFIWPFELVLGPICLMGAAVFMRRRDIKNSWLGDWPRNCPDAVAEISRKIWEWIFDDWTDDD